MAYRDRMLHDQIALQLYTVRGLAAVDLPGTLRSVAAAGYRAVELAGLPETAPSKLARLLGEAGLRVVAAHEGIERLRDDAKAVADRLATVGCPRLIIP
jgi:sugar phosphate isomerase/epimerase